MDFLAALRASCQTRNLPGRTGWIVSQQAYRLKEVPVLSPALVVVLDGEKQLFDHRGSRRFGPGCWLALPEGLRLNLANIPDGSGHYRALVLGFTRDDIRAVTERLEALPPAGGDPYTLRVSSLAWEALLHYLTGPETAYRKFKRPFRAVCWVGGGRASPVLGTDRTSVSGISASRGHAAALSAAMLR